MKDKLNILITGAFGNIGTEIIQQILNEDLDYKITAFDLATKQSKKIAKKFAEKLQVHWGDITDLSTLNAVCKNQDVVIHLAGIIPPAANNHPEVAKRVNIDGTENIVKAVEKDAPNAILFHSSSVTTYGDRNENPWLKVTDKLIPGVGDIYSYTKIEAEKLIRKSNTKFSIFRLSFVLGYGNHKIDKVMFTVPLNSPMEIITIHDVANMFVRAIEKRDVLMGNTYNVGGGANCRFTYLDLLESNFKAYGLGAVKFPENSFATNNWKSVYYEDGHILEDLLHFQSESIEDYFKKLHESIPSIQRMLTKPFSPIIRYFLGRLSEPKAATKEGNQELINRFFKNGKYIQ